jgi:hypothetical protein
MATQEHVLDTFVYLQALQLPHPTEINAWLDVAYDLVNREAPVRLPEVSESTGHTDNAIASSLPAMVRLGLAARTGTQPVYAGTRPLFSYVGTSALPVFARLHNDMRTEILAELFSIPEYEVELDAVALFGWPRNLALPLTETAMAASEQTGMHSEYVRYVGFNALTAAYPSMAIRVAQRRSIYVQARAEVLGMVR